MAISKSGVYSGLDIDLYHSQACADGPSVSSSGLRTILRECPAKFFATSDLNPQRFPVIEKESLNFGKAAHALVLGEPEFFSKFIISPYDDFRTKSAQQWRDEQTLQVVRQSDMELIEAMAKAQRVSPECANAFTDGEPEQSIFLKTAAGIWLKARPDWLPHEPTKRWTVEYKTAVSIDPRKLSSDAFSYGYEIQAALSLDLIAEVMGVKPLGMAHVVQEKSPPFLCELRLYTSEQIDWGRQQYSHALAIFDKCLRTNDWPGYTLEPTYFMTPGWVLKNMEHANDGTGNGYEAGDYLTAG